MGAGDTTTPGPWVVAHDAARSADRSPAQLLLAGVNAHINYDLVLAVSNLLVDRDDAERRRHDYERVNDVIAATADEVQDGVLERYVPWAGPADVVLGRLDEWMAVRLLRSWRADVWRQAERLLPVPPADRATELARNDARCCRRGRLILLHPA